MNQQREQRVGPDIVEDIEHSEIVKYMDDLKSSHRVLHQNLGQQL